MGGRKEYEYQKIDRATERQDEWYLQRRREIREEESSIVSRKTKSPNDLLPVSIYRDSIPFIRQAAWDIVSTDNDVMNTIISLQQITSKDPKEEVAKFLRPGGEYQPDLGFRTMQNAAETDIQTGPELNKKIFLSSSFNNPQGFTSAVALFLHEANHMMDMWYSSEAAYNLGKFQGRYGKSYYDKEQKMQIDWGERGKGIQQRYDLLENNRVPLTKDEQISALSEMLNASNEDIIGNMYKDITDLDTGRDLKMKKLYQKWYKHHKDLPNSEFLAESQKFEQKQRKKLAKDAKNTYEKWGTKIEKDLSVSSTGMEMGYAFEKQAYGFYQSGQKPGEWIKDFQEKFDKKYAGILLPYKAFLSLPIFKKSLDISHPQGEDEKEADSVAHKIVNGEPVEVKGTGSAINRKGEGEEAVTEEFKAKLESSKGSGEEMEDSVRSEMESKMSSDLSEVKIHTGSKAHEMSDSINAKAFTHGQDIYFKDGNYNPDSKEGKELLAHELVHTVQQSSGKIQPKIQRQVDPSTLNNIEKLSPPLQGKIIPPADLCKEPNGEALQSYVKDINVTATWKWQNWYFITDIEGKDGYIESAGFKPDQLEVTADEVLASDKKLQELKAAEDLENQKKTEQLAKQKTIDPSKPLSKEMQTLVNWNETLALFTEANKPVGVKELSSGELKKWVRICLRDGWLPDQPVPKARDVVERTPNTSDGYYVYSTCSFDEAFAYGRREHRGQKFYWYYNIGETILAGPSGTDLSPDYLWANVTACEGRTIDFDWINTFANNPTALAEIKKIPEKNPKERLKSQAFYDLVTSAQKSVFTDPKDVDKINGTFTKDFEEYLKAIEEKKKEDAKAENDKTAYYNKNGKPLSDGSLQYVRDGIAIQIKDSIHDALQIQILLGDIDKVLKVLQDPGVKNQADYLLFLGDDRADSYYRLRLLDLFINGEGITGYSIESELSLALTVLFTQKFEFPLVKAYLTADGNKKYKALKALLNDSVVAKRIFLIGAERFMPIDKEEVTTLINTTPFDQGKTVLGMSDGELKQLNWQQRETVMDNIVNSSSTALALTNPVLEKIMRCPQAVTLLVNTTPPDQKESLRSKIYNTDYQKKLTDLMTADQRKEFYAALGKMFPNEINNAKLNQITNADNEQSAIIASELTTDEQAAITFDQRWKLISSSAYDSKYIGGFGGLTDYGMEAIINLILTTPSTKPETKTVVDYTKTVVNSVMDNEGNITRRTGYGTKQVPNTDPTDRDQLADYLILNDGSLLKQLYDQFSGDYLNRLRTAVASLYEDTDAWGNKSVKTDKKQIVDLVNKHVESGDTDAYKLAWFLSPVMMDTMSADNLFKLLKLITTPDSSPKRTDNTVGTLALDILNSINKLTIVPQGVDEGTYNNRADVVAARKRKREFQASIVADQSVIVYTMLAGMSIMDDTKYYNIKKAFFDLTHEGSLKESQDVIKDIKAAPDDAELIKLLTSMSDDRLKQINIKDRLDYVRRIVKQTFVFDEKEQLIINLFRTAQFVDETGNILDSDPTDDNDIDPATNLPKGKKSDADTMLDALTDNGGELYNQIASAIDFAEFPAFHATIQDMGMVRFARTHQTVGQAQQNLLDITDIKKAGEHTGATGSNNIFLYANPGIAQQLGLQSVYNINVYWAKDETGKDVIAVDSYSKPPLVEFSWLINPQAQLIFDKGTPLKNTQYFDPWALVAVQHLLDESPTIPAGTVEYMMAINLFNIKNSQNKQKIWQAVDVALTLLSFVPVVGVIAGTIRGLRAVIALVDFVIMASLTVINDYRASISKTEAGRNFLFFYDMLTTVYFTYAGVAGVARLAMFLSEPKLAERLMKLYTDAVNSLKDTPAEAKLTKVKNDFDVKTAEGNAPDNILNNADKTGNTSGLKEGLDGAGINPVVGDWAVIESNKILDANKGGAGVAIKPKEIKEAPVFNADQPNVPKNVGFVAPKIETTESNIFYWREPIGNSGTQIEHLVITKPSGTQTELVRPYSQVTIGSQSAGGTNAEVISSWKYKSGAIVQSDDAVYAYVQNPQLQEGINAVTDPMKGAQIKTAEGIAGKIVAVVKTPEVTKPKTDAPVVIEIYKVKEPEGLVFYRSDGRTFMKGNDGKFYEKKGSVWVERTDLKTQSDFEKELGATMDSVQFKRVYTPFKISEENIPKYKFGEPLADDEIVVYALNPTVDSFKIRPGVDVKPLFKPENLEGIDTIEAEGKSCSITLGNGGDLGPEYQQMFGKDYIFQRSDAIAKATVKQIREAGFDVVFAPTIKNNRHCRIIEKTSKFDEDGRLMLHMAFGEKPYQKLSAGEAKKLNEKNK